METCTSPLTLLTTADSNRVLFHLGTRLQPILKVMLSDLVALSISLRAPTTTLWGAATTVSPLRLRVVYELLSLLVRQYSEL